MKSDPLPLNNQETLESMKERFSTKLTYILYEKLTVDNIETFADDALDEITTLTTEIMEYYYDSNNIIPNANIEFKDQEDDAYTQLGLPKISNILDLIEEKKNEIDKIKDKIKIEYTDVVITPPQEQGGGIIPGDSKGFEKKKLLPRLLTLMYILENDLEVNLENVKIPEGKVYANMMRQTPYVRVEVSDLERLVYICDEEGNVSYVFDTEKLKEKRITPEDLDIDNKGDKNSLIAMHPGIGVKVVQTKNWRDKIKDYLENDLPVVGESKNMLGEVEGFEEEKNESEFKKKEKNVYLRYEEWVQELKADYEADKDFEGSFLNWYKTQVGKHKGWMKSFTYAVKNYSKSCNEIYTFIGYERKVNRRLKEEILTKEQWLGELKKSYEADKNFEGEFYKWYRTKSYKHTGWRKSFGDAVKNYVTSRDDIYTTIGYVKKNEVQSHKDILPKEQWLGELKAVYEADKDFKGEFSKWYKDKAQKYKGWLKSFSKTALSYNISFNEIYTFIGYERKVNRRSKEEILTKEQWLGELKSTYKNKKGFNGSFQNWYKEQAKKRSGWIRQFQQAVNKYNIPTDDIYNEIGYTKKH